MSRATQMLFILSIIMAGLFISGLLTKGGSLFEIIVHPSTFTSSDIYVKIELILTTFGSIGGLVAGLLMPIKLEQIVTAVITIFLIDFGLQSMVVFDQLAKVSSTLAIVITGPIELLILLTMLEWWRSSGTS